MSSYFPPFAEPPGVVREGARSAYSGSMPMLVGGGGVHRQRPVSTSSAETSVYGVGVIALVVDEPDGVEDLHRPVRVEARDDLRDRAEVPVHELAEPPVVVDRAGTGAPADEELEARDAERVLDVDGEQADAKRVVRGRADPVLLGPGSRFAGALLVGNAPDLADPLRPVELGHRQFAHREPV